MKLITIFFSLILAFNANAGLITTVTTTDSQVTLDFALTDFDSDIFELIADFSFNETELAFASYTNSTFVEETFGDIFSDPDNSIAGSFALRSYFFLGFSGAFNLGQAVFDILPNVNLSQKPFTNISVEAYNFYDLQNPVSGFENTLITKVPEPSTIVLFSLITGFMLLRSRNQSE